MARRCSNNLRRALLVADYILEGSGHTVKQAAEEFRMSQSTVKADLNLLASISECDNLAISKEARKKYVKCKITLEKLAKRNRKKSILIRYYNKQKSAN